MTCTRCDGTGFLNTHQLPEGLLDKGVDAVFDWLKNNPGTDVTVCDCCGNGEEWYGTPGQHYGLNDPMGQNGPYAWNGGLCMCH